MFTFEDATNLHAKFTELYEAGRICAALGFALSAWFVDPGGNTIGMLQFKDKALG
jgi:hypothetical protein